MTPSFAVVTPSFAPDLERCRLLAESFVRYAAPYLRHYIVIDRRDARLFAPLAGPRTDIVLKEDVLPGDFLQMPALRRWWLDRERRRFVRGWIVQQITKLAVPRLGDEDVFVFADSDTFFVRDFDPRTTLRDDLVPAFHEEMPHEGEPSVVAWHQVAERLLGLQPAERYRTNYVSQLVTWRRDNVLRLHDHVERVTGRRWWEAIGGCSTVSEYFLYGIFCEKVLGDGARHYWRDAVDVLAAWSPDRLDEDGVRQLRGSLRPEHAAVMVSARSETSVALIRRAFQL